MLNILPRFFVRFVLSVLPFTGLSAQDRGSPAVGARRVPMPIVRQPMPIVRQPMPIVRQPMPIVRQPMPIVRQPMPIVRQPTPIVLERIAGQSWPPPGTQWVPYKRTQPQPEIQPEPPPGTQWVPYGKTQPQAEIKPQPPRETGFLRSEQTRQIPAASDQTNAQLAHTVISPNGTYTAAIVRDGAEMRLYLQKGGSYTLVGVYNTIEGVTWSKDSSTVRFRATKAVGPEKVEERKATYQPATQVLKWHVIRVMRIST